MSSPKMRPSCLVTKKVQKIYETMNIDDFFDTDMITPQSATHQSLPSFTSPLLHNTLHQHLIRPNASRPRRAQSSLFDFLPQSFQERYGDDNDQQNKDWGTTYKEKAANTIRIWYTNPNGLGVNPMGPKSHSTFSFLHHSSKADIICLAETNLNWPILQYNSRLNNRIRAFFREFYSSASNNKHETFNKSQRGGTCTIAVNQITHRVHRSGIDTSGMGRWSWVQIDGKNNHRTRVLSAYRPCKPPSSTGLTTTWDQQDRYIRTQGWNRDPRSQFDYDLRTLLQTWIDDGIKIVISTDANENIADGQFNTIMTELGLNNVHDKYGTSPLPPTHERGSYPISGIFASPTLVPSQIGILSNGQGILGDHRNMYVDFQETIFMGNDIHAIPPPSQRRLQLFDSRIVRRFNKACLSHLKANGIPEIADTLFHQATYPPPPGMSEKLEAIDEQIDRAIRSADKKCRKFKNGAIPFSETFRKIRDERRFWMLVLRKKYGRRISSTTIRRLAQRLKVESPLMIDFTEVKRHLKNACKKYFEFIKHAKSERDQFIESLAEANVRANNKPKEKVLRRIKHDEEQRIDNHKLKVVYKNRNSNGWIEL